MTEQEKKQKMYQLYAVLGELGIFQKQKLQELESIKQQTIKYEEDLVAVIKIEIVEELIEEDPKEL